MEQLARRAERGLPTPCMENIPTLYSHLQPVWDAFDVLHRGRDVATDVCRLRLSEMFAYLDGTGVADDELRELYVSCLQAMDDVVIEKSSSGNPSANGARPLQARPHARDATDRTRHR
jgi:hypothetical protein